MEWSEPRVIALPRIYDPRGSLTFAQNVPGSPVPFTIERVYWIYDVPGGESRGAHAHKELQQFIVAASGSFTLTVTNGERTWHFMLCHPYEGLYLPPGYWRHLREFASGSVALVLASRPYDEDDYIRDYDRYMEYVKSHR